MLKNSKPIALNMLSTAAAEKTSLTYSLEPTTEFQS